MCSFYHIEIVPLPHSNNIKLRSPQAYILSFISQPDSFVIKFQVTQIFQKRIIPSAHTKLGHPFFKKRTSILVVIVASAGVIGVFIESERVSSKLYFNVQGINNPL